MATTGEELSFCLLQKMEPPQQSVPKQVLGHVIAYLEKTVVPTKSPKQLPPEPYIFLWCFPSKYWSDLILST